VRAGLLLLAALAGCGRFDFDEQVDAGAPSGPLTTIRLDIASATTTSTTFEPIPDATITLPPSNGTAWLLLVSGSLASTSPVEVSVEARYTIDGVEAGIGGTQNDAPGRGGPWQHFDVIRGASAPIEIAFELRDDAGGTASLLDMHAIAVPLPAAVNAGLQSNSSDPLITITTTANTPVVDFDFVPVVPGPYLVLGLVNASDGPGSSDVYVQWRTTEAVLTKQAQIPRMPWQSMLSMWVVPDPIATRYSLYSHAGTPDGSLRYVRWVALPLSGFVTPYVATTGVDVSNSSSAPMPVTVLPQQVYGTAAAWLYLATVKLEEGCAITMAERIATFTGPTLLHRADHIADNCASQITYGTFQVLDAPPPSASIEIASGNTEQVTASESAIAILGIP
jgi:hypothetical protein